MWLSFDTIQILKFKYQHARRIGLPAIRHISTSVNQLQDTNVHQAGTNYFLMPVMALLNKFAVAADRGGFFGFIDRVAGRS